jgi:hypothetical protein
MGNWFSDAQICPIFNNSPGGLSSQCTSDQALILAPQPFDRSSRIYCPWVLHPLFDQNPLGIGSLGRKYVPSLINNPPWGLYLSTPAANLCSQNLKCLIVSHEHPLHGFCALRWSQIPWQLMTLGLKLSYRWNISPVWGNLTAFCESVTCMKLLRNLCIIPTIPYQVHSSGL